MNRIEALEASLVRVPLGAARGGSGATEVQVVFVAVTDDAGHRGTGFTYALTGGGEALLAMVQTMGREVVRGAQVSDWPSCHKRMWDRSHRLGRGVAVPALSAIDIAVWDLRGVAAQVPLHRLFGVQRDSVPAYGSGRATNLMTVEELVEGARAYLDEGYRAVKLRAGTRALPEELARVTAVREAVGDDVTIMVDVNERLDFPSALWLGRELADLGVLWLEEPLVADDVAGHAELARRLPIAIAAGEHLQGRFEFSQYLRCGAAAVLQPDAPLVGGVTEWMRVAILAEALGATVSPHFLPELHVHLCLAAPACNYIEHFPLLDDLFLETLAISDGVARAPERPGHGILWDPEALERFAVA